MGNIFVWQCQAELNQLFLGLGCSLFALYFDMSINWHQKTLNLFIKYSGQFIKTSSCCIAKFRNPNTLVFYYHSWQTDFNSWAVHLGAKPCSHSGCAPGAVQALHHSLQLPGPNQLCLLPWQGCKIQGARLKMNPWKSPCKDTIPWATAWFRLWF